MTTVSVAGYGSGIDVDSLVSGLVQASSGNLNLFQQRASDLRGASSTLSSIGSSLSALQSAADAISSADGISSYSATSSNSAVVASANGNALPSSFTVNVTSLAKEQRTYSATFSSNSTALNQSGTLGIKVGSGTTVNLAIASTDSLDAIAAKINGAGLRANASVFYDGSAYRLQVRGLDTGAANNITFTETGTSLDLNGNGGTPTSGKTVQSATDASVTIDGFTVTRPTNQITGAVQGVTLALTATTSSPATVTVAGDPSSLKTKVNAFVNSFNSVITAIHTATGYGSSTAQNPALAADSALRSINDRLASFVGSSGATSGTYQTLADIGIILNRDGTLRLDDTKLSQAISTDPGSVTTLLARPKGATSGGMMADLRDVVSSITASDTGVLVLREQSFDKQATTYDQRATDEQNRLNTYADNLRKQFTAMNNAIGQYQLLGQSLSKLG